MRSETAAANATAVAVRNGTTVINDVTVEQRAPAAPVLYLQVFNTNAPTVGTTLPRFVIEVPAGNVTLDNNPLRCDYDGPLGGAYMATGLAYAVTTTQTGNTNPTAGQEPRVVLNYNQIGA